MPVKRPRAGPSAKPVMAGAYMGQQFMEASALGPGLEVRRQTDHWFLDCGVMVNRRLCRRSIRGPSPSETKAGLSVGAKGKGRGEQMGTGTLTRASCL